MKAELIAAVRERACITDLFAPGELRRAGRDFLALCPWHNDRRPSLTVSPQRNRVHCFVCSRGADPIGWLQDRQGLSFPEAVEALAQRYGIPIPAEDPAAAQRHEAEQRERSRLRQWRAELLQRFQQALQADLAAHGPASRYLQQRGLSSETAVAWQLGLHQGRLMLPISDGQGRCCGFSGRSLDGTEPKYRNSCVDALFRRSELVFGLHHAAPEIRRQGEVLLVEGPLDVIQLHQEGITHAVAALGTSLSPGQRQLLQRTGARRLVVAFDGDEAGRKATARLLEELRPLAISGALELAVLDLPADSDPDSLLRQEGPERFRQRLGVAVHWLQWELEQLLAPTLAAPEDLAVLQRCERQAVNLLALLPAGPLRRRAEQRLKESLGAVPQAPVWETGAGIPRGRANSSGPPVAAAMQEKEEPIASAAVIAPGRERAERRALRLYLCSPACRDLLGQLELQDPICRQAMSCLRQLQQRLQGLGAGRPAAQGSALDNGSTGERSRGEDNPCDSDGIEQGADDPLMGIVLALCSRLDPPLADLLQQVAQCGVEVRRLLARDPVHELEAVLEALEPVESNEPLIHRPA